MPSHRVALLSLLCAATGFAQTFEVASIRLSGPKSVRGSEGGPGSKDPERYTFNRVTLNDLIIISYEVEQFQISSKLPLDRETFDLTAKVPSGASKDEFRAMLRNLLAERFHLRSHMENKEFPAFEMIAAKGGTKLGTPAANALSNDFPQMTPGKPGLTLQNSLIRGSMVTRVRGQQQTVPKLAKILRIAEPRPIIDKTGLTGTYDFTLAFSSDLPARGADPVGESPGLPDLNMALRDQLGLQLVAKKLPFDVVVVDSFDRTPTEN